MTTINNHNNAIEKLTIFLQLTISFRTHFDAFSDTHFGRLDALGSCVLARLTARSQNAPGRNSPGLPRL
jgi:hypothetical protein